MFLRIFLLAVLSFIASTFVSLSQAFETLGKQAILVDAETGVVLYEKNADQRMPPSSMSKIMTIHKIFEALKKGNLRLEDTFLVSEKAWRKKGSKMFVSVNSRVKVEDLIRGVIVQSGNDASIVIAEGLSGSESAFAEELNETAKSLGMNNTNFINASGWPDKEHYTTARDLSKLAISTILKFPDYYHYYSQKFFEFNGIKQRNRNPTLYRNIGADGLKTGHTEAAGFGLTASAKRNDRRLILVLNGLRSSKARVTESERVLDWGFRTFSNYKLFEAGEIVEHASVWMGDEISVPLIIERPLTVTLRKRARKNLRVSVVLKQPVPAPIRKGDQIGSLVISVPDEEKREIPLKAGKDIERLGFIGRLGPSMRYILWGEGV